MNHPTAEALQYGTCYQVISQFYLHTHMFIHERNRAYLPLLSKSKLVLVYRPWRDRRLSWHGQPKWTVHSQPKSATQRSLVSPTLTHSYAHTHTQRQTHRQTNKQISNTQTNTGALTLVCAGVLWPKSQLPPPPSGFVCISKYETKYFVLHTFLKLNIIKN